LSPPPLIPESYMVCQKIFPILDIRKSPLTPLFHRGELTEILLKVPL
jgi:hypothetical protein